MSKTNDAGVSASGSGAAQPGYSEQQPATDGVPLRKRVSKLVPNMVGDRGVLIDAILTLINQREQSKWNEGFDKGYAEGRADIDEAEREARIDELENLPIVPEPWQIDRIKALWAGLQKENK